MAGVLALVALVAFGLMPVAAQTNPFSGTGIDVSYPNCSSSLAPASFAIVGVTDGRPFTTYKCLSTLWGAAKTASHATPSAYFNTGYSGAYGRDIVQACKNSLSTGFTPPSPLSRHALKQADQAWEIGCSEAYYAYATLTKEESGTVPTMLFADIETGNSWSSNVALNGYAIDGISWGMANSGTLGYTAPTDGTGIYSSASMWKTITGSAAWSPKPQVMATWVTDVGGACPGDQGFVGFDTSAPTWISQKTAGGIDTDIAC